MPWNLLGVGFGDGMAVATIAWGGRALGPYEGTSIESDLLPQADQLHVNIWMLVGHIKILK